MPTFDGSGNVQGFFSVLEEMCARMGADGEDRRDFLLAQVKGPVYSWLQDQESWRHWTYEDMKEELCKEYALELSQNVTRLENLEFRGDVAKFNEAFRKISTTCKKFCPEVM
jgi:hypothetical protein